MSPDEYDLIVTIVKTAYTEKVIEAAKAAGAEGATILNGRGIGVHEQKKLFGIAIEPEKGIILTLINREKTRKVFERIIEEAHLDRPATGVIFVIKVSDVAGIVHACPWPRPEEPGEREEHDEC